MQSPQQQTKNKRIVRWLLCVAVGMFGFGFALIPLYNVMCDVLGINGKTGGAVSAVSQHVDKSREIIVQFVANNNENLPWKFHPNTKQIEFHPGEITRISYFAQNDSNHDMTVQAIPSVTPGLAAKYLKKTECFCFTQQTLKPHEKMDMPLLFHIDPDLPKNIHTITLSYTLFDVTNRQTKNKKLPGKIN